jgi:hypothetical protein
MHKLSIARVSSELPVGYMVCVYTACNGFVISLRCGFGLQPDLASTQTL